VDVQFLELSAKQIAVCPGKRNSEGLKLRVRGGVNALVHDAFVAMMVREAH